VLCPVSKRTGGERSVCGPRPRAGLQPRVILDSCKRPNGSRTCIFNASKLPRFNASESYHRGASDDQPAHPTRPFPFNGMKLEGVVITVVRVARLPPPELRRGSHLDTSAKSTPRPLWPRPKSRNIRTRGRNGRDISNLSCATPYWGVLYPKSQKIGDSEYCQDQVWVGRRYDHC